MKSMISGTVRAFSLLAQLLLLSLALSQSALAEEEGLKSYIIADEYLKRANEELVISLVFNPAVEVRGNPALRFGFTSDNLERVAVYAPEKSGVRTDNSSIISFVYVVKENETSEGLVLGERFLAISQGYLVRSSTGEKVDPKLHERYDSLPVTIDGVSPSAAGAVAELDSSRVGTVLHRVRFSEDVIVAGTPYIPVEVVGSGQTMEDKAWFDRESSSPREKVFRWNAKPGSVGEQQVTFVNRIEYDGQAGRITDLAGNELKNLNISREGELQQLVQLDSEVQPEPEEITQSESEERKDGGFPNLEFGIGVGIQGLTATGDDKDSQLGYRVSSKYKPMLEASIGYNFFTWPSRLVAAATLGAYQRGFERKVNYDTSGESDLDSDAVDSTELFAGLSLYWKPAPKGFGAMLQARQDKQFVVLAIDTRDESELIDVSTLAYGLGVDYHFDLLAERWGLSGQVEGQQTVSSEDDSNTASKALDIGLTYGLGLEWLSRRARKTDDWFAARLYYNRSPAETKTYEYVHEEAGFKIGYHF